MADTPDTLEAIRNLHQYFDGPDNDRLQANLRRLATALGADMSERARRGWAIILRQPREHTLANIRAVYCHPKASDELRADLRLIAEGWPYRTPPAEIDAWQPDPER